MSYEGYTQFLCERGHYWTLDCYETTLSLPICPKCKKKAIWNNHVDITNGSFDKKGNQIDNYKELKIISETKCKHCKSVLETRYQIPKISRRKK